MKKLSGKKLNNLISAYKNGDVTSEEEAQSFLEETPEITQVYLKEARRRMQKETEGFVPTDDPTQVTHVRIDTTPEDEPPGLPPAKKKTAPVKKKAAPAKKKVAPAATTTVPKAFFLKSDGGMQELQVQSTKSNGSVVILELPPKDMVTIVVKGQSYNVDLNELQRNSAGTFRGTGVEKSKVLMLAEIAKGDN